MANFCLEIRIFFSKVVGKNRNFLKICLENSIFLPGSTTPRFQTRLTPLVYIIITVLSSVCILLPIEGQSSFYIYLSGSQSSHCFRGTSSSGDFEPRGTSRLSCSRFKLR